MAMILLAFPSYRGSAGEGSRCHSEWLVVRRRAWQNQPGSWGKSWPGAFWQATAKKTSSSELGVLKVSEAERGDTARLLIDIFNSRTGFCAA